MSTQQVESARCPQCNAQAKIVIRQIIDAQDLVLKSALLQGRIHAVPCPQCNAAIVPALPTLYYDTEKQFALVFAPASLHLAEAAQETTIAELTAALSSSLSPEQQAAYLVQPQRVASLRAMVDAILAADGIDPAVVEAQTAKAALIGELLQSASEAELKEKASAHHDELDASFFELLTAYMQAAQMEGNQAGAQTLLALRTLLGQWTEQGQAAIAAIDAKLGLDVIQSREELLSKLLQATTAAERDALVATGYVLLDQTFFQLLNGNIAQATANGDTAAAKTLKGLSAALFELKAAQETKNRAALDKAGTLFKAVVQSDTPDQVLKQQRNEIDEAFFVVLGAHIERARRQGQAEPVRALEIIGKLAHATMQERQPA